MPGLNLLKFKLLNGHRNRLLCKVASISRAKFPSNFYTILYKSVKSLDHFESELRFNINQTI